MDLNQLEQKYMQWTHAQQAIVLAQIGTLVSRKLPTLADPIPGKTEGRPLGSKTSSVSSTKREPSALEIATKKETEVR
ncbi:hypothetical protein PsorP6_014499 [Peronosclerospora sorghi]|uniref:Uncharacterized protein n=1 Tax=Peronosclerospora sorghi TaxID=230839 RepID=A0ACC0VRT1_9STRA|nr:hypothetical protein PsorP6_014499 [Peronosclerospora sorghi]